MERKPNRTVLAIKVTADVQQAKRVLRVKLLNARVPRLDAVHLVKMQFFVKTTGKRVEFIQTSSKLSYARSKTGSASHWDAFEFLARNGELKINGHSLEFWNNVRNSLLNGGEYTICTSRADVALRELSFLSGKKFSVISGNAPSS